MRSWLKRVLTCERCGQQVASRAARWWGDEDYLALQHDYFTLEASEKVLRSELSEAHETISRLTFLIGHLHAPTAEQIEIIQLRAILNGHEP